MMSTYQRSGAQRGMSYMLPVNDVRLVGRLDSDPIVDDTPDEGKTVRAFVQTWTVDDDGDTRNTRTHTVVISDPASVAIMARGSAGFMISIMGELDWLDEARAQVVVRPGRCHVVLTSVVKPVSRHESIPAALAAAPVRAAPAQTSAPHGAPAPTAVRTLPAPPRSAPRPVARAFGRPMGAPAPRPAAVPTTPSLPGLRSVRSEERRVGKEWVSTCRSRG